MIFLQIWQSFRAMPVWVQLWAALVLAPANLATLAFISQPSGGWIALLAIGGMAFNMPILFSERGFSKLMALPHILIWTPLLFVIWSVLSSPLDPSYATFLRVLFTINLISLAFDYPDLWKWWKGDRAVAGAEARAEALWP